MTTTNTPAIAAKEARKLLWRRVDLIEIKECDKCDLCEDHHDMPISDVEDERFAKLRAACEAALKYAANPCLLGGYHICGEKHFLDQEARQVAEQLQKALNQ